MKLLYSFLKDLRLAFKSYYIYMELGFALIFVAVLLFVVPENFDVKVTVYAHVDLEPALLSAVGPLERDGYEIVPLSSPVEVRERLAADRGGVGLLIGREDGRIFYEYVLQGYEDEKLKHILRTAVESSFAEKMPGYRDAVDVLTLEGRSEKLSDRLNILPVYLALNAAFMGLFIIAAYIFLDKEEGTIKAFAVTPAKVWHYLFGKMGVLLVAGLMSGLTATAFVAGTKAHYLHLVPLLVACNAFGTALGLFISSFFETMAKAMGWLYITIIVLSVSTVSYYMPSFAPLAIRLLPSYPMLFAFRETLYEAVDLRTVYLNVAGFAAFAVVIFLAANWRFKKTLTV